MAPGDSPRPTQSSSAGPRHSTATPTGGHIRSRSSGTPHAVPPSYAYGAPSLSPPDVRKSAQRREAAEGSRESPSLSGRSAGTGASLRGGGTRAESDSIELDSEEDEDEVALVMPAEAGRAVEPAQVRYQRLAERRKSTGQTRPPPAMGDSSFNSSFSTNAGTPISTTSRQASTAYSNSAQRPKFNGQNTTVNIATAFASATRVPLRAPVGAAAPRPSGTRRVEESFSIPETSLRNILARHEERERETREHSEGASSGSGKETHTAGPAAGEGSSKKRKKPSTDPTFKHRQGETSDDSVEEESQARAKSKQKRADLEDEDPTIDAAKRTSPTVRRKSSDAAYRPSRSNSERSSEEDSDQTVHRRRRSKGKGRTSNGSAAGAIPIGIRDAEVWNGRKRKGRKGRRSIDLEGGERAESDEDESSEQTPQLEGDSYEPPQELAPLGEDDDRSKTSYLLAEKSTPRVHMPGHAFGSSTFGSSPADTRSPYKFTNFFRANNSNADADLANISFASSFNTDGQNLSLAEEGVKGNSYDYAEEEQFVRDLEEPAKRTTSLPPRSPSTASATAANSSIRKRAGPGLQSLAPPRLNGIEEEPAAPAAGPSVLEEAAQKVKPLWSWVNNPLLDWSKIWTAIAVALVALLIVSQLPKTTPTDVGQEKQAFSAPDMPAETLSELISRLSALESATDKLASSSKAERAQAVEDRKAAAAARSQVHSLASDVAAARATALAARDAATEKDSQAAKALEQAFKTVKADVQGLVSRVRDLDVAQADEGRARGKLQSSIDGAAKELASLTAQVANVQREVEEGRKQDEKLRGMLDALEKRLPARMAVEMDDKGRVQLDPAFWKALREAFPAREEVDKNVGAKIDSELAKRPQPVVSQAKGDKTAPPPAVSTLHVQPKWDDFLATNEAALKSLLHADIEAQSQSGAILSRRTVLDILRKEMNSLKKDFERSANENVEQIGQEILRKVAKQDEMRRAEEKERLAAKPEPTKEGLVAHLNPFHRSHAGFAQGAAHDDVESLIHAVVDSALVRYSKDVLARPDYALYSAGARIIPALTSPTYEPAPLGVGQKALAWFTGAAAPVLRPPVMALHPDLSLGACWPFKGDRGQLGIALSRKVVPTDITIEHAALDVALDGDAKSAPREFELWGVVEGARDVKRLAEHRVEWAKRRLARRQEEQEEEDEPVSLPDGPNHFLVASGAYDPQKENPLQTFPVSAQARELSLGVRVVVLKVTSNHGEGEYTCLYRVRVGGRSVEEGTE